MREVTETLGPPGTGKTTSLLNRVEEALADGRDPSRIAVFTFTKKAAGEARERAITRFGGDPDEYRYWSTIHSVAFRSLGLSRDQMLIGKRLDRFGEEVGLEFNGGVDEDGRFPVYSRSVGDSYLRICTLAKSRQVSLLEQWQDSDTDLPFWAVQRFSESLASYKSKHGLYGFDDLLETTHPGIEADLVLIDEVQDLSRQQINYVRRAVSDSAVIGLYGDDDQSIFVWAGADRGFMRNVRADRTVLGRSWRLPRSIKSLADVVINRCYMRIAKTWEARDEEGSVDWVGGIGDADLLNGRSWLLLARHRRQLADLVGECRRQGVVYQLHNKWSNEDDDVRAARSYEHLRGGKRVLATEARRVARSISGMPEPSRLDGECGWVDLSWPERITPKTDWMAGLDRLGPSSREYIRELRRNNEPLHGPGRVKVSTVHGAKGGEADDVFLLTDIGRRTARQAASDPDAETRVMYVGMTRARHRLLLAQPQTAVHWKV
jgi:DNA helicase-2/ATP-dependent DNA helicase PcrA